MKLTLERSQELNRDMVTQEHLIIHSKNVMAAMEGMAKHFGEDSEHWKAIGYLHDFDYEKYPEEHLQHTAEPLREAGVDEGDIRAILSHGYGLCSDVEPLTDMEKSLFTVDELTGIIQACARMRPHGITDLEVKSVMSSSDKAVILSPARQSIHFKMNLLDEEEQKTVETVINSILRAKRTAFFSTKREG